ncbi:MAG: hypothetical protein EOP10_30705 [Proteobacteria bacterium]|nr:MAG: hypothetical protein EOP10_30705 [Pseudomonadota bacterium]
MQIPFNRFSSRSAPLSMGELPAALVYFPSEKILPPCGDSQERELELCIEIALQPRLDAEDEIFDLADQIEQALLSDSKLEELMNEIGLETSDFIIDGDGESVVAAAQQTYRLRYLSENPKTIYA